MPSHSLSSDFRGIKALYSQHILICSRIEKLFLAVQPGNPPLLNDFFVETIITYKGLLSFCFSQPTFSLLRFGLSERYFLNVQNDIDIRNARREHKEELEQIKALA